MSKFSKVKISDIGQTITGKTPSSNDPEDFGSEFMFVTPSDSFDKKMMNFTERYLSVEGVEKLSNKLLPPKSIMVTCIGSAMGKVAMNETSCITNQQINSIVPNKRYDSDYIYYAIKNNYKVLRNAATGSTALPLLNKTDFDILELPIHEDKTYQQKVSSVLSPIDAKIEINNRINRELEAMAKTLYDYWFVQFDFPNPSTSSGQAGKPYKSSGGKMVYNAELKRAIPEGWEVKKLGDLGDFKNGVNYDPSNPGEIACPIINVRNISASSFFIKNEDLDIIYLRESDVRKYSVNAGSIIIARSGIPGATRMISDIAENTLYCGFAIHYSLNNLGFKIPVFFFLKSLEEHIQSGSGGTILKNVNQGTLNALKIVLPKEDSTVNKFNNLIEPIFGKITNVQKQNQHLTTLRDWLLPMLMNGQVTVRQAHGNAVKEAEERLSLAAEPSVEYKKG